MNREAPLDFANVIVQNGSNSDSKMGHFVEVVTFRKNVSIDLQTCFSQLKSMGKSRFGLNGIT